MKVAVIQLKASSSKENNFQQAVQSIQKAAIAKAKLIVLPEMFLCQQGDYHDQEIDLTPLKEMKRIKELAKKHRVYILAGSVFEKEKRLNLRNMKAKAQYYNTSCFINPEGKVAGKYRKIHLFDANIEKKKIRESEKYLAGFRRQLVVLKNFRMGLSICYDLRFPSLYKEYFQKGAEIFSVPSAFTYETGKKHWEVLLRARAIENFSYVLAANLAGKNAQGVRLYGNSMIVGPQGDILARASLNKAEILYAELQKKALQRIRNTFVNYQEYL